MESKNPLGCDDLFQPISKHQDAAGNTHRQHPGGRHDTNPEVQLEQEPSQRYLLGMVEPLLPWSSQRHVAYGSHSSRTASLLRPMSLRGVIMSRPGPPQRSHAREQS